MPAANRAKLKVLHPPVVLEWLSVNTLSYCHVASYQTVKLYQSEFHKSELMFR